MIDGMAALFRWANDSSGGWCLTTPPQGSTFALTEECRSVIRVRPFVLVLVCLVFLFAGVAAAQTGLQFSTNPPDKQFNFYRSDDRTRAMLNKVEKYHWPQALKAVSEENWRRAATDLTFILRYFPNHPFALDKLSEVALSQGKAREAEPYFEYALQFSPNDPGVRTVFGMFRHRQGKYKEAVAQYRSALKSAPDSADVHYNLGLSLFALKEFGEARRHAKAAYRLGHPLPGLRDMLQARNEW